MSARRFSYSAWMEEEDRKLREWEAKRLAATAPFTAEWNAAAGERMALPLPRTQGVYFVEAINTGLVKIGWAKNIAARVAALQRMNGATLRLLRWESGTRKREKKLHRKWDALRVHGEWFIVTERLAHHIGHVTSGQMARVYQWLDERGECGGIWGPDPDFGFRRAA